MVAPLEFPHDVLKYRSFQFDLAGQVITGGLSQSGLQQVVNASGGGVWTLRLEGFKLRRPEEVRAWRAIQFGGHAGVYPINVSICDLRHSPTLIGGVPHSDTSPFSDMTLYISGPSNFFTTSSAGVRAPSIQVGFYDFEPPEPGQFFSLPYGDNRHSLHVITSVQPFGSSHILRFVPPLRAAIPEGTAVEFDKPMLTMRQAGPDAMSAALVMGKFMEPSATFVEYFE